MIGRWFWRLIAWSTDAVNQAKLDQELLKAIQYNKLGLVNRLHAEGASVNCRNEEGRSPLHLSVYSDWDRISHFLIDMGADLNAKGKFGGTPLHLNFGKQAKAKDKLAETYRLTEKLMDGKDWLVGDGPTVADNYLFVTLLWADKFDVDLPQSLVDYRERNKQRDAVNKAMSAEGLL